jgi:hypothetical protein
MSGLVLEVISISLFGICKGQLSTYLLLHAWWSERHGLDGWSEVRDLSLKLEL